MLERIDTAALSPAQFVERYGVPAKPVILRGLFAGQPIADISSKEEVVRRFGSLSLRCTDQQSLQFRAALQDFVDGRSSDRAPLDASFERFQRIDDYLREPASPGGSRPRPAPPQAHQLHDSLPSVMRPLLDVPAYCDRSLYPWCKEGGGSIAPDRLRLLFLGRSGHFADLHSHRDLHHIFLHQLFGRKKLVLLPPQAAGKIGPVMYMSSMALQTLGDEELEQFVRYASGVVDVLAPGETLFLPATWWHYFDYLDDAMSINMRFAEPDDEDIQFLIRSSPDYRVKRVAFELRRPEVLARHRHHIRRLRGIARARRLSAQRRYGEFIGAVDELYRLLAPNESRASLDFNDIVFRRFNASGALGLRPWRHRTMDVMRQIGHRLAALG